MLDDETALVGVPGIEMEQAEDVADKLNNQFPRKDNQLTCQYVDDNYNVFHVFVTSHRDFKGVH